MDTQQLLTLSNRLFDKRGSLMSLFQTIAENVYVERADFTASRSLGTEFADNLTTSYPLILRRDLGNAFSAMLRPTSIDWFHVRADREEYEDQPALEWLEKAGGVMRRAMYDRGAQFQRATKEGDHDFAAFGQAVLSVQMNKRANGLLYRNWHLRDVAWCEDEEGRVSTVHRKWKPTARDLVGIFGSKCHEKVHEKLTGPNPDPYCEINCRHIVMPAEHYDGEYLGKNLPYVSIYLDVDHNHMMEAVGQSYMMYVVPRWQTVSGSQYAFSPATVAALPDARLLQAMTEALLEAGEKAVNPPMVAVQEALRSDVSIYARGITWVDAAYDERLGEVLRPLTQDKSGIPFGIDLRQSVMETLQEAFFINKLNLPTTGPEMTAYEVGQRIQEYIRQAAPIFEPMESEYNGALCETTFELMMAAGAFGRADEIPESIRGREIMFRFESPLHDAIERQKGQKYQEVMGVMAQTASVDPTVVSDVDVKVAFRDTVNSIGAPAKWLRSEDEAQKITEQQQEAQQSQELLATLQQGGEAAKAIGEGGQALAPEAMAA